MKNQVAPPEITYHYADLPLTKLHYIKCGQGPPLVMVPATISKIEHWAGLAQFMGQKFTVYYFELPGHGKSSSFAAPFSSELVAETIGHFMDSLGYESFNLMGFSFGGILTLKALHHLQHRIERMILFSPCVSHRALTYSRLRVWLLRRAITILKTGIFQKTFVSILHSPKYKKFAVAFIKFVVRVEDTVPLDETFHELPISTLDVLSYQLEEVINLEFPPLEKPYSIPLMFAMSIHDTLLDFTATYSFLDTYFSDIYTVLLTVPYHQPPEHPTFWDLQRDNSAFIKKFPL